AVEGEFDEARARWRTAIEADGDLLLARLNRDLLDAEISLAEVHDEPGELKLVPGPGAVARRADPLTRSSFGGSDRPSGTPSPSGRGESIGAVARSARVSAPAGRLTGGLPSARHARDADAPVRIAILSFLFNWPSTGGGNMHTAGLVEFLG